MVYILSEENDLSTDLVLEWLKNNSTKFIRINDNKFSTISIGIEKISPFNQDDVIWHRRGRFNLIPDEMYYNLNTKNHLIEYLEKEENVAIEYLEDYLKINLKNKYIGSYFDEKYNNKLTNLYLAKKVGFNIPDTIVSNDKNELAQFIKRHKEVVYKDLRAPVNIKFKDKKLESTGVRIVTKKMIEGLNKIFSPIFIQEYIEKFVEIRIFFFNEKMFPMAIFSQMNEKTKIDFRNYDDKKTNRNVPFEVPFDVKRKIKKFLKLLRINTGSIDLILTPSYDYYFLEINPMGQFHWLSANCNYHVEKYIADFLSK